MKRNIKKNEPDVLLYSEHPVPLTSLNSLRAAHFVVGSDIEPKPATL